MIILYHGSYMSVPAPLTGVGRRELDFGPGFYVTTLRDQAERWARRVCIIRALDTPTISTYEFDETILPANVRRLHFDSYDQQWLDFIVSSRRGEEPWKEYDTSRAVLPTTKSSILSRTTMQDALPPNKPLVSYASPSLPTRCVSAANPSSTTAYDSLYPNP